MRIFQYANARAANAHEILIKFQVCLPEGLLLFVVVVVLLNMQFLKLFSPQTGIF